ncbi:MAG: arylamine N-acetyltransferase [Nocardioidaceae bacterium]
MGSALEGYLRLLGFEDPPSPTLSTLVALHRAHLRALPYENLGIMLGRPPSAAPTATVERIATVGRAGYCFHHNGALEMLLSSLGFAVRRWHGQVFDGADADGSPPSLNHLVLEVSGLPSPDNPGGRWWADAGLGDGFLDPVPLVDGPHRQHGFHYSVSLSEDGWTFRHDPAGSFSGVRVRDLPAGDAEVGSAHDTLALTPGGHFTRFLVVQRRGRTGVDALRGCVLERVEPGRRERTDVTSFDDWRGALTGVLGLPLDDLPAADVTGLWERTLATHRAWDLAGRP